MAGNLNFYSSKPQEHILQIGFGYPCYYANPNPNNRLPKGRTRREQLRIWVRGGGKQVSGYCDIGVENRIE